MKPLKPVSCTIISGPPPRWTRRQVGLVGIALGVGVGMLVAAIVGVALDSWQCRSHVEIKRLAEANAEAAVCRAALEAAIVAGGGRERVDDVLAMTRDIRAKKEWRP